MESVSVPLSVQFQVVGTPTSELTSLGRLLFLVAFPLLAPMNIDE